MREKKKTNEPLGGSILVVLSKKKFKIKIAPNETPPFTTILKGVLVDKRLYGVLSHAHTPPFVHNSDSS